MKVVPLDKLLKDIDSYVREQENHPIKRSDERMSAIYVTAHWCKNIADLLSKEI